MPLHLRFSKASCLILGLVPAGLLAQVVTQLSPLEFRPPRAEASAAPASRNPSSFAHRLPAPVAYRMGRVSQAELDGVARDPMLTLMGIERAVDRRARMLGQWLTLDDGRQLWRMAIRSEGADGVRVEFSDFHVGAGEVWIYSEDGGQVFGPYSGSGIDDSGEFWSHTIFADTVVVEYQPDIPGESVPFAIPKIFHRLTAEQTMAAGSCELDMSCYPDWSAIASGVGLYFFQKGGAGYACTGSLVNNTNHDAKPYFLTANHCVSDAPTAKTVDVFWNYQTASCNGKAPSLAGLPQTLGATYLASAAIGSGDYSLILLAPLPNLNLTFYGWNGSVTALPIGGGTTDIHHPQADYKRIAFGVRSSDVTAQIGSETAPANLYYYVQETSGRIEPGSSGSPLFTADKMVVGTLTYGPGGDACSINPFYAGYGRFSAALPALASYLSPLASTPPPAGATASATPSSIKTGWTIGSAPPAAQNIQVTTTSPTAITVTARTGQSWIQLSAPSVTVSQGRPATLAVSFNPQGFTTAGANTGAVALSGAGINQSIAVELDVAAATTAVRGGPVTVIPLFLDGSGMATTFTLVNPYATATVASISFTGANGAAIAVPAGQAAPAAWQNVTIPAFGAATVATAGTSSPQKQGFATIQSGDPAKRVQAWAQINGDIIDPAVPTAPPFVAPFDATGTAFTTLYLSNPAAAGTLNLNLSVYDTTGLLIGTGSIGIPGQQEGAISMSRTAAVFGGRKGILVVTGTGPVSAMAIRTAADGRLSSVAPELLTAQ